MAKFNKVKEVAKAEMRLANIENRFAGNSEKIFSNIMLRTDRMSKTGKLFVWAEVLWAKGYRKAAMLSKGDARSLVRRQELGIA